MCDIGVIFQRSGNFYHNISQKNHNLISSFEINVKIQREDSLPTRIHNIRRLISKNRETKTWVQLGPFQGTQICALWTYFSHHAKCDGDKSDSSWFFPSHHKMTPTCVELHDFGGQGVLRLGGYEKWVRLLYSLDSNTIGSKSYVFN